MQKQLVDARAKRNAMDGETKETGEARDAAKAAIAKGLASLTLFRPGCVATSMKRRRRSYA